MPYHYEFLKKKETAMLWKRIGIKRRAGILCPLFSLYSRKSVGIGEYRDLRPLIDWCISTKTTLLQLLPLNDMGFGNSPYASVSSFALDPIYLSLDDIKGRQVHINDRIKLLQTRYPTSQKKVNYAIKADKLQILWDIFQTAKCDYPAFARFKQENTYWLEDYVSYTVLKKYHNGQSWQQWDPLFKNKDIQALSQFRKKHKDQLEFYRWVQWQSYEQFKKIYRYAEEKDVYLIGDIPFLVSRDSADVWGQYQCYFNLNEYAGCPPDAYNALGQKWGMPGYHWKILNDNDYVYFTKKLQYASHFYQLYRIDHVVGMFRLWVIDDKQEETTKGLHGRFDPENQCMWRNNGKNILKAMIRSTKMLPCAEDLGVVPIECIEVLEELGIPGIDVQRWLKHRDQETTTFKRPEEFRQLAIAVSSSHDMSNTATMWQYEFETTDEWCFKKTCQDKGIDYEWLAQRLFQMNHSHFGRLRWKKNLHNTDILLWNIEKNRHEVEDIVASYKETFDEKKLLFIRNMHYSEEDLQSKSLKEIVLAILQYVSSSASIFSIHSMLDILLLEYDIHDLWHFRINFPGTVGDNNWTLRLPVPVESLANMSVNTTILDMNHNTNRG